MARALTTSEAVQLLISKGYQHHQLVDNAYTTAIAGKSTTHIEGNERKGIGYSLTIWEDHNGNSAIDLVQWNDRYGKVVIKYSKLNAAQKKEFIAAFA